MSLVFMDGFDHYIVGTSVMSAAGFYNGMWDFAPVLASNFSIWSTGVQGYSAGFDTLSNTPGLGVGKRLTAQEGFGVGFHFYFHSGSGASVAPHLIVFRKDATNDVATLQRTIDGALQIATGISGTTIATTDSGVVPEDTWVHIEWYVKVDGASGETELRVNGVALLSETYNFGTDQIDRMFMGYHEYLIDAKKFFYDNLFVWDTTGSENNTFMGELNIKTIFPDSDDSSDWTAASGSDIFEMVNNVPPNGSDYIESTVIGDTAIFGAATLGETNVGIKGVLVTFRGKKDGAVAATVRAGIISGATTANGDAVSMIQGQYAFTTPLILENNPDTSAPWTVADIEAIKLKIERVS